MRFSELNITSNFTFLKGGSSPEEYAQLAALMGLESIAIADENSVAGIIRAYSELKEIYHQVNKRKRIDHKYGKIGPIKQNSKLNPSAQIYNIPKLLPATRLVLKEKLIITALPINKHGWSELTKLLSLGNLRAPKGKCYLNLTDIIQNTKNIYFLVQPPTLYKGQKNHYKWVEQVKKLIYHFPKYTSLIMSPKYNGMDSEYFLEITKLAKFLKIPFTASASPIMHKAERRQLTDVLTAIRTKKKVANLGKSALTNAEQRMRDPKTIQYLFQKHPKAIEHANEITKKCSFSLDDLKYEYPCENLKTESAKEQLKRLAIKGLKFRYPKGASKRVLDLLEYELNLINKLNYEPYFLTVNNIVSFAKSRGIFCQGRGSAANSVVCYLLGITSVSPEIGTMVFERFVSEAREEPPDIDVDFEHERREEVIQYIYEHYGRNRAGICATVIHYRGKRAIREVGQVMGLDAATINILSKEIWSWGGNPTKDKELLKLGIDVKERFLNKILLLSNQIQGFPRHLSQHVGGFVITQSPLDELVPIENATMKDRTVISWDKDDIQSLGILKIDILALGMLTCIRKAFNLINKYHHINYNLSTLPQEDPLVYDMLCKADSIGVFQVESRAQMNFLPRMRPRCFYDLVIEVAIVRPGPIQGEMVHPYIRRRNGKEKITLPSNALGKVLNKTLGVPLFQEQAMQIAIIGASFSPNEADRLRRSLTTFKKHGNISVFRTRFLKGMQENGYDNRFAKNCFDQIEGFGSYGFPESHAASFAFLVYASAWLKYHHPGIFACALLNSQPMGFYAPAQIINDAKQHGVKINPVDINASFWDNVMETDGTNGLALRLGFRQISFMKQTESETISNARGNGYQTIEDVWRRARIQPYLLNILAGADVFLSLKMSRREAIWQAKAISGKKILPLFSQHWQNEFINEARVNLPDMTLGENIVEDYISLKLSLRVHPVALLRHKLTPGYPAIKGAPI